MIDKKKIVIDNYFKVDCNIDTTIREAYRKGFERALQKLDARKINDDNMDEKKSEDDKTVSNLQCLEELRRRAMMPKHESPNPDDNYETKDTLKALYEMERKKLLLSD